MSRTDHHSALGHCQLTISAAPRLFWSAELCSALLITAALHCTTCQQPQTIVCSAGSPGTTPTSQDKKSYKLAKFTTQSSVSGGDWTSARPETWHLVILSSQQQKYLAQEIISGHYCFPLPDHVTHVTKLSIIWKVSGLLLEKRNPIYRELSRCCPDKGNL